jgi:hypothetical protein
MYHTFLLRMQLSKKNYIKFENIIREYFDKIKTQREGCKSFPKNNPKRNHKPLKENEKINVFVYTFFDGVIIRLTRSHSPKYHYYGIEFEVNPARFYNPKDLISLSSADDLPIVVSVINKLIKDIGLEFSSKESPKFNAEDMQTRRIDFAKNFHFESKEQTERYMSLLKKHNLFSNLEIKQTYVKGANRKMAYTNSVYMYNNSRTLNVYCKGSELEDKNHKVYYEENIDLGEKTIRFEIQNNYSALVYLKRKDRIKSYSLLDVINKELTDETLMTYCEGIFGVGDYITIDKAFEIIHHHETYKTHVKDLMCKILKRSQRLPIWKVVNELDEEGFSDGIIRRTLKKFDKIGINPVTIPISWGYVWIPGSYRQLNSNNKENLRWIPKEAVP